MRCFRLIFLTIIGTLLVACGGGGGSSGGSATSPTPAPTPPPSTPPPSPPPAPPPSTEVGLDARPSNVSCIAPTRTATGGTLGLVDAFPALPGLDTPVKLVQAPNENNFYVIELGGAIQRFSNDPNTTELTNYMNIGVDRSGEGGLLGIAFDPDWPVRPHIYVSYTVDDGGFKSRLSRLIVEDDTTFPVTHREEVLLEIDQPTTVHNGGDIHFGPDRSLYFGLGDGGPDVNSQATNNWLGSMLRIDVLNVAYPSPGYNIPASNPFASNTRCSSGDNPQNCPEIYAWGFRNPWRWSFDTPTGNLWLADVGEATREEINLVEPGQNYGWRCKEGSLDYNTTGCDLTSLTDPIYEFTNNGQSAITGGYVYRGSAAPELFGRYIFADFVGAVSYLTGNVSSGFTAVEASDANLVIGFGIDRQGEVYVLSFFQSARILKFDSSGGTLQDNMPEDLIDTGCVSTSNPQQPSDGLIPYEPIAPFWSDGSDKERWLALPDGSNVDVETDGDFGFPTGTVLMKNFSLANQLVETRLFVRHPDGDWAGYTYQWNSAATAASRVRNGAVVTIGGQDWNIPSEAQCLVCHTEVSGRSLGLETAQLNHDFTYPQTGITDNQLEVFNHIDLFSVDVPEPVDQLSALVDPFDTNVGLSDRARAYLHTNCAGCHRPNGPTGTGLDLRYSTALSQTQTCDTIPNGSDLGISDPRLIAPGQPDRSVLLSRMDRRDGFAMPPISSTIVDSQGVSLIREWITQLSSCM